MASYCCWAAAAIAPGKVRCGGIAPELLPVPIACNLDIASGDTSGVGPMEGILAVIPATPGNESLSSNCVALSDDCCDSDNCSNCRSKSDNAVSTLDLEIPLGLSPFAKSNNRVLDTPGNNSGFTLSTSSSVNVAVTFLPPRAACVNPVYGVCVCIDIGTKPDPACVLCVIGLL